MAIKLTSILAFVPELNEEDAIAALREILKNQETKAVAMSMGDRGAAYLACAIRHYCDLPPLQRGIEPSKATELTPTGLAYDTCPFGAELWEAIAVPRSGVILEALLGHKKTAILHHLKRWAMKGWVEATAGWGYCRTSEAMPFVYFSRPHRLPSVDQILALIASGKRSRNAIAMASGCNYKAMSDLIVELMRLGLVINTSSDHHPQFYVAQELEQGEAAA